MRVPEHVPRGDTWTGPGGSPWLVVTPVHGYEGDVISAGWVQFTGLSKNQFQEVYRAMEASFAELEGYAKVGADLHMTVAIEKWPLIREHLGPEIGLPFFVSCVSSAKEIYGPEAVRDDAAVGTFLPLDLFAVKGSKLLVWDAVKRPEGWELWFSEDGDRRSEDKLNKLRSSVATALGIPTLFDRSQDFVRLDQ